MIIKIWLNIGLNIKNMYVRCKYFNSLLSIINAPKFRLTHIQHTDTHICTAYIKTTRGREREREGEREKGINTRE